MTSPVQQQQPQQLTAAQIAALLVLVQAQAAVRRQITRAAVAAAVTAVGGFTAWWDAGEITAMIGRILRVVQPLQRQAAQVTDGYVTQAARIISGDSRLRPAGAVNVERLRRKMTERVADEILAGVRRPVRVDLGGLGERPSTRVEPSPRWGLEQDREFQDPAEVYGRIADGFRYATTVLGDSPEKAQQKAVARVATLAETDVTLAVREQYRKTLGSQQATGWRRILHPELSETGPCGLCVVAADRVYRTEDLLPLHNRCVCEVLPVYGRLDPGITLNGDDLRAIYEAAGGNTREQLRQVRVVLTEHGELGPLLVRGDEHYRSPQEVARAYASSRRVREQAILDALLPVYEQTRYRVQRGDSLPNSLRWQQRRIEELRRSLRRSS